MRMAVAFVEGKGFLEPASGERLANVRALQSQGCVPIVVDNRAIKQSPALPRGVFFRIYL